MKHIKELRIGKSDAAFTELFIFIFNLSGILSAEVGHSLELRKVCDQGRRQAVGTAGDDLGSGAQANFITNPEGPLGIRVKAVVAHFMADIQKDQNAARHPIAKPEILSTE